MRKPITTKAASLFVVACLLTLAGSQAFALPIYDVQYTIDVSGDSPYNTQIVTVSGIVTAEFYNGFTIADAAGPWNSIFVFTYSYGPDIGDEIEVTGLVDEYYNLTEIKDLTSYTVLSTGNAVTPTIVNTSDLAQESYETVLVTIQNITVATLETYGEYTVDDGSGAARCDDRQ